ncbi:MAG: thiamine-phosphate kinase [Candidatus Aminicenantes bacterium]|nr:thiamine-phosphate kinase [Candidatus Aminicenantes bacterium]
MNEPEFVLYLKKHFPFSLGQGIGDDTSVVKINNHYQLITTDILIENTHFRLTDTRLDELAMKALAVNQSDIAAMGGKPHYFYLGLGFPHHLGINALKKFFQGLKKACLKADLQMAGGDFSHATTLFISITMVGTARHPVYRNTAKEGDFIGITGPTGASALGLKLLQKGKELKPWTRAHKQVIPQIHEGQILSKYVNAMIDVSDGLIMDLKRILKASGKGGEVEYEKIPVPLKMKKTCRDYDFDELELVLTGGEDYVLLFTISPENELKLREEKLRYNIIGIVDSRLDKLVVSSRGQVIQLKNGGYDHFKSS